MIAWLQEFEKKVVPYTLPQAVLLPDAIEPIMLFYDIETSGFNKSSDILQLSITRAGRNPDEDPNVCMLPTKTIDARAYKVHGLFVSYEAGRKQLLNKNIRKYYPL